VYYLSDFHQPQAHIAFIFLALSYIPFLALTRVRVLDFDRPVVMNFNVYVSISILSVAAMMYFGYYSDAANRLSTFRLAASVRIN